MSKIEPVSFAVLGGSGFYEMPGLSGLEELRLETPYGRPSDAIRIGELAGQRVAFLARHGAGHRLLPSELPQRANFWALKSLGVTHVLAVSAVGSLRAEYRPGELVVPDQLIDRLRGNRPETFFGDGVVAHVGMAEPFCPALRDAALSAIAEVQGAGHDGGTYVVIEGPSFGTKAESHLYRQWGASIVGMTALPEARLAREAEICYAIVAAVTDYDSWHESEEAVTADAVFATMRKNVETSQAVVRALAIARGGTNPCTLCPAALDAAMVTAPAAIPEARRRALEPFLGRWLGKQAMP